MEKTKKAQAAVIGVFVGFLLIAVFAIMLKPMLAMIDIGVNATANASEGGIVTVILNNIPVVMALVILIAIVALISGGG